MKPPSLEALAHRDLRGVHFSEQVISFRIPLPRKSVVKACVQLENDNFAVFAFAPATLVIVDSAFSTSRSFPLSEYFPPQNVESMKVYLFNVPGKGIGIYAENQDRIVFVDTVSQETSSMTTPFLNVGATAFVDYSKAGGVVAFYQRGTESLVLMDFRENRAVRIQIPAWKGIPTLL